MDASHVFMSHSSAAAVIVRKLREALEPCGLHLWIDRRELAPGDALDPARPSSPPPSARPSQAVRPALALQLIAVMLLGPSVPSVAEEGSLATAFDWTHGTWVGVRIDAASGRRAPMTMRVEPILGGAGQIRHIEVEPGEDAYYGFAVQVPDAERSLWIRQYTNAGRGYFSLLEGEVKDERTSVWRGASPGRSRESRLLSERLGLDGWRRTMSISEDGGETWQDLWIDELER